MEGSAGEESTCRAGDPSLIPGLGRSPEEGTGYPLQYSWASLVAQLVKNLLQACNTGDPALIPESERSPREEIGYPSQYSWASLVSQRVKNLSAMWEAWIQSLGWEDTLKEGTAIHSSILAWRIPMDGEAWWATIHGVAKSQQ